MAAEGAAKDSDRVAVMRARLVQALHPLHLEIVDESAEHVGHAGAAGGAGHYRLLAVSARFEGLSRVRRHRLVYDLLIDLMQRDIHALAMTLLAPDEAAASRQPSPGN
jgi:BolA protein